MSCRTIEHLILAGEDRPLDAGERRRVDGHLRGCTNCRAFASGRAMVRGVLRDLQWPEPPPGVDAETRRLCREEMAAAEERAAAGRARAPVPVLAATVLFTILASAWLTFALADAVPGGTLSAAAWGALVLIAQNGLVLFLAPVILRAVRPARGATPSDQRS